MSFILDALKKSEAERQRQNAPGIANIPESGRQKPGPKWGWIIGGLLALNLGVLGAIMLRPAEVMVAAGPEPRPAAVALPPVETAASVEASRAPGETPLRTATPVAERPMAEPEPAPASAAPSQATAALPSFNEVRAQGVVSLPDMHLDIHVYSGQPSDRFVFVNMTKYTEGAQLAEGPAVREITPDGVVLDYLGTTFLLPRE
ncbi:MAG: general secretion pathway protein GspB [Gammaproteobacteria bacterium]|nr:general secretion pathway protein GspB [Gammaproteobacteria bacterium]